MTSASHAAPPDHEWPEHFVQECPSADAYPLDREIFYLVETNPPTSADFRCALDRGVFVEFPLCLRVGLSCAVAATDLYKKRERVPRLRRHHVASATLSEIHGRYLQTTHSLYHHTMWLRRAALMNAPVLFSCQGGKES